MNETAIEFLLAPGQNAFFVELAAILRDELVALGRRATVTVGAAPDPRADRVQVLIPPHEYSALTGGGLERETLERMIFVCAEPPASPWFEGNVALAPRAGALFDINQASIEEFESRGISARHLALGYSATWDRVDAGAERDVDITFMGCATDRRERILSGYAPILARRRCELVISDNEAPNAASGSSFLAGEDKWALLGRSKVLLNVHREDFPPYFEWVRILEAIHCGAVVVSETSSHHAPLEPGTHFVSGDATELARLADELLDSPERLERVRADAYAFVRERLPLRDSAAMLAEAADEIAARPLPRRPRLRLPRRRGHRPTGPSAVAAPTADAPQPDPADARRSEPSSSRVSVIVAANDRADLVDATLDSVSAGGRDDLELVVIDDDGAAGRNAAIERSHGDLVLTLDAGDELFANGLARLTAALDQDPSAAFAYGILQGVGEDGPEQVAGFYGWEPERLATDNYIDGLALIRRRALEGVGGYDEAAIPGREHYDLWRTFAERGLHGAHVREFVARYRISSEVDA